MLPHLLAVLFKQDYEQDRIRHFSPSLCVSFYPFGFVLPLLQLVFLGIEGVILADRVGSWPEATPSVSPSLVEAVLRIGQYGHGHGYGVVDWLDGLDGREHAVPAAIDLVLQGV
jgi:hypothetical protein